MFNLDSIIGNESTRPMEQAAPEKFPGKASLLHILDFA